MVSFKDSSDRLLDCDCMCPLQYLQTEYDQLEGQYEAEKSRAAELESSLQKAAEELSHLRITAVDWTEEKEKLSAKCEQLTQDVNVCATIY